jgi:hypothetical protein
MKVNPAKDKDQWQTLVSPVMNLWLKYTEEIFRRTEPERIWHCQTSSFVALLMTRVLLDVTWCCR